VRASAFLYPWDVVGDPAAADRIAALGVEQVTLASAYHTTRALTPRHPGHRFVTARHAATLYPPDPARWAGRALHPYEQGWVDSDDPFAEAAESLRAAGLEVHSWVVLAHNSRLGEEHPRTSVVNAYGDRYPWAPCIAHPDVRDYVVDLAAEAAVRPGTRGTELESLGWYGLGHLHAHDKIGGVRLDGADRYLLSLCFCTACRTGYVGLGLDPEKLRGAVLRALEPVWDGRGVPARAGDSGRAAEWAGVERLLGPERAEATLAWRGRVARETQEAAIDAVRVHAEPGFQVLLHADPALHRCGANAGVDPAHILGEADGVVLPCTGGAAEVLEPFADHRTDSSVIAANFTVVAGMGGSPRTLAADAAHAAELGANELRLYHAGLAAEADLAVVRDELAGLR
jgi:hypothetical protein